MPIAERDFGRLEGKVDAIEHKLDDVLKNQGDAREAREKVHERIDKVEKDGAFSAGRQSVIGSLTGFIGGAIAAFAGKHFG